MLLTVPQLAESTFPVSVENKVPSLTALTSGVPQGYILGLIIFSLDMLSMSVLIQHFVGSFHFNANDTQLQATCQ